MLAQQACVLAGTGLNVRHASDRQIVLRINSSSGIQLSFLTFVLLVAASIFNVLVTRPRRDILFKLSDDVVLVSGC